MVFSSHIFVFYFLPLALALYYAVPRRGQHVMLILLSYVFYGWANPLFVVLMFASTLTDYVSGLVISGQRPALGDAESIPLEPGGPRSRLQKGALVATIILNLCLLGFFKYFNFGIDSYNALVASLGLDQARWEPFFRVTLPLGISFYTFHAMSYAIDVYRGDARAIRNYIDYACYVAMFPQLVAGPIIRFQDVADQLRYRTYTAEKFARGVAFFCFGMAKKVLLANPCGKVADLAFDAGSVEHGRRLGGHRRLCLPDLLRLLRLLRHGDRPGPDAGLRLRQELRFAVPVAVDHRILAALAHLAVHLAARLPLHPAGRQPEGAAAHLRQSDDGDGARRALARRLLEFRDLGRHPRPDAGLRADAGEGERLPEAPRAAEDGRHVRDRLLRLGVLPADTLPRALAYCASLLGLGHPQTGAGLIGGVIYQPYYLASLATAAAVTWLCPQTWDFTRRITWPRAAFAFVVLWASLVMLTAQSYNPFIYFLF